MGSWVGCHDSALTTVFGSFFKLKQHEWGSCLGAVLWFLTFCKKSSFLLPLAVVLGSLYDQNIMNVAPASVRCTHFWHILVNKACFYCPWQQKKGPVTNDLFAVTGFCGTKPICQRGFSISSNDVTLSPLIINWENRSVTSYPCFWKKPFFQPLIFFLPWPPLVAHWGVPFSLCSAVLYNMICIIYYYYLKKSGCTLF